MNKRITSILLVLVMCMTMVVSAIPAFAADAITLTIARENGTKYVGDTITYTISIGEVEGLRGANFTLVIPEGLEFVGGTTTDGLKEKLSARDATFYESSKTLVIDGAQYSSEEDTDLMTFTCKVNESALDKTLKITLDEGWTEFSGNGYAVFDVTVNNDASAVTVTADEPAVVPVTAVTLNEDDLALTVGETAELTATVDPENATDKTVTWTTSDPTVATVDANGNVTAVGAGTAIITAEAGDETATCTVTVTAAPVAVTGVTLAPTANMTVGETKTLTATVAPADATNKDVTWVSSDPTVATVENGVVKAVKAGEATITVTTADGGFTATCTVTVTAASVAVTDVTLGAYYVYLTVGETRTLTATVIPANATNKNVTWTTSDPTVATVDENGMITAVGAGNTTITAKAGGKTATCVVIVEAVEKDPYYTAKRDSIALQNIPTVYRLTFKTNGGSAIKDIFAPRGTAIPLNAFVSEKEGYAFDGWYEDEALTKPLTSWKVVSNKTVYAAWTEADSEIEIVELPFIDVFESDSYYADVEYVYSAGLMNGVSELLFAPDKTLSRAMIVTILYRLEGEPAFMNDNIFTDVEADSWYEKAVVWANGKGIVLGYGDGTFGPTNNVTREQMAAILYRYAEYKGYDVSADEEVIWAYEDAENIDAWALSAMQWACGNMLLDDTDGALRPVEDATRAEVAVLLHRFCVAIEG